MLFHLANLCLYDDRSPKSKENKTKKKEPKSEIETKKEPIKEQVKHSAKKDQLEPRKPNFLAGIKKFDKNKLKSKNELERDRVNEDAPGGI